MVEVKRGRRGRESAPDPHAWSILRPREAGSTGRTRAAPSCEACRVPAFGLCDRCAHQRMWGNRRGSTFSLCGRAKTDERFPKYPPMPVGRCVGFEERPAGTAAPRAAG